MVELLDYSCADSEGSTLALEEYIAFSRKRTLSRGAIGSVFDLQQSNTYSPSGWGYARGPSLFLE